MLKTVTALATVSTLALAAVAAPSPAQARGGRLAAGIIGGIAAGAIIGGAFARPYYGGPYAYYGGPAPYYGGPYAAAYPYGPGCFWRRERIWTGYGWAFRPVRICY